MKFQVVERVSERLKKTHKVIDVDGVRVLFEHGWGLVRASNTQPVLVMRFEAESEDLLRKYREEMEASARRSQGGGGFSARQETDLRKVRPPPDALGAISP